MDNNCGRRALCAIDVANACIMLQRAMQNATVAVFTINLKYMNKRDKKNNNSVAGGCCS